MVRKKLAEARTAWQPMTDGSSSPAPRKPRCPACARPRGEVVAVYQPDRPPGAGGIDAVTGEVGGGAARHPGPPSNFRSAAPRPGRALAPRPDGGGGLRLILPQSVLDIPCPRVLERACIDAAALARRRADPAGDRGQRRPHRVCLMQMEKGLDTGPVLLAQALDIGPEETGGRLHDRLRRPRGAGAVRRARAAAYHHPVAAASAAGRGRDLRAQSTRPRRGSTGRSRPVCWPTRCAPSTRGRWRRRCSARTRAHPWRGLPSTRRMAPYRAASCAPPRRHRRGLRGWRPAPASPPARGRQGDHRR